jgi:putative two-component system response regulator
MEEREGQPPQEEFAELEAVEDIEDAIEELAPVESRLLTSDFLRNLARSYEKSAGILAILGLSLEFVYQNPFFKTLMRDYGMDSSAPFPAIFGQGVSAKTSGEIRAALADPGRNYMWEGTIEHRTKDSPAKLTRVHVWPLYSLEEDLRHPTAYSLLLDDFTEERKAYLRENLTSLLRASLKKDRDTGKHVQRVNLYSRRLAAELYRKPRWPEVDVDYIEEIGFLAAMHDVGKIGTPDDILNKKGPLTEAEWKIMQEHTINGAYILSENAPPMAKQIALSHHEWWNGTGYPYNLMGKDIPLASRIVTVADVYDALRMKRSYKAAFSHETAWAKMLEESGTHFDPELIEVFTSVSDSFERIYSDNQDS